VGDVTDKGKEVMRKKGRRRKFDKPIAANGRLYSSVTPALLNS
jgi:hypothetical protein